MTDQVTDDWLTLHSPRLLAAAHADAKAGLQVGAGTVATVYCLTNVGGAGLADALAADDEVAKLLEAHGTPEKGTHAFDKLVDKFSTSPLSGVATVTEMAFTKSGMNAAKPDDASNLAALSAYGNSINQAPFFSPDVSGAGQDPGSPSTGTAVVSRLIGLLQPRSTTFAVSWINVAVDAIDFGISTFGSDAKGHNVQSKSAAWAFQMSQWPVWAERVATRHVTTVKQWQENLATPLPGTSPK